MEDQELGFEFIPLSAHQPSRAVFAKPIPLHLAVGISSFNPITPVVSNSQGELEDGQTRLRKELKQSRDLYKSARKELQAKSTTEKGELEDILTRPMSGECLYDLAYPELQAMSVKCSYNFACSSTTEKDMFEEEKRSILEPAGALALAGAEAYCKYYGLKGENVVATTSGATMNFDRLRLVTELADVGRKREAVLATYMPEEPKGAGTSKGERLQGEGEDDVTVQHEDAIGSVFMERLKDDDLLFSLSSQPPNFALSQRAEERAEEREDYFAWVEGLGKVVSRAIKFGKFVAPFIAIYLLNKNTGKKFDDFALQIKAANEARIGTTGCASPISCNLNISMFNAIISASPRLGFLNREKRGNDVEVTGSK